MVRSFSTMPVPPDVVDRVLANAQRAPSAGYTLSSFVAQPAHWRVMADLGLLSLFAGLYSVPMYALIQMRSQASHRARHHGSGLAR